VFGGWALVQPVAQGSPAKATNTGERAPWMLAPRRNAVKRPDLSGMTATANHACKLQEMIKDHLGQYNLLGITDTTEER
jgi:hypothetical protein